MSRRDEVVALLRQVGRPLDDGVGGRLGINRHYANQVYRQLVHDGATTRSTGDDGKLLNRRVARLQLHLRPACRRRPSLR